MVTQTAKVENNGITYHNISKATDCSVAFYYPKDFITQLKGYKISAAIEKIRFEKKVDESLFE